MNVRFVVIHDISWKFRDSKSDRFAIGKRDDKMEMEMKI
jgi:hypothetical protein